MSSRMPASVPAPPRMYSFMPVQKLPEPTADGIRSDASKRNPFDLQGVNDGAWAEVAKIGLA